jgi:hypothetical protein
MVVEGICVSWESCCTDANGFLVEMEQNSMVGFIDIPVIFDRGSVLIWRRDNTLREGSASLSCILLHRARVCSWHRCGLHAAIIHWAPDRQQSYVGPFSDRHSCPNSTSDVIKEWTRMANALIVWGRKSCNLVVTSSVRLWRHENPSVGMRWWDAHLWTEHLIEAIHRLIKEFYWIESVINECSVQPIEQ